MKIILIDNVKGTGKKDEVKEVKDGYGSFLIKNRKAVLYSDRSKDILKTQIKEREDKEALLVKEMNEIKNFNFQCKNRRCWKSIRKHKF